MNKAQLAETLGVSIEAINAWIRRGCPYKRRGRNGAAWEFDLQAVLRWRADRQAEKASHTPSRLWVDRLEKAKALQAEVELGIAMGRLVDSKRVEDGAFRLGRRVRDALLSVPDRVAPLLAAEMDVRKIDALLRRELTLALEGLGGAARARS